MSGDSQKSNEFDGFIPTSGYMTATEIARRIKVRDERNLRNSLIELGVDHIVIAQRHLFHLESFEKLFWKDNE